MARVKSAYEHGFRPLAAVRETKLPKEGTKLRAAYDLLFENKGRRIPRTIPAYMIRDLMDQYGCDIRRKGWKDCDLILVGEWQGDTYVDYTTG